jgi:ATP-binding cassette subfamily G (WHITE) protein 2
VAHAAQTSSVSQELMNLQAEDLLQAVQFDQRSAEDHSSSGKEEQVTKSVAMLVIAITILISLLAGVALHYFLAPSSKSYPAMPSNFSDAHPSRSATSTAAPIFADSVRRSPASITFRDLALKVKNSDGSETTVLQPCSGHFPPEELVAIMGPSGSGKTTLLDMLANRKTCPYDGEVKMNGQLRDELFLRVTAYVGQDDALMPQYWTVKEAVAFNRQLKGFMSNDRSAEVESLQTLLKTFGLDAVQDTFVGGPKVRGISGGQRRRLTLARGVASCSSVLFCDEPTSGLSGTDAHLCVQALRNVAKEMGTLVVIVIHQPRAEVADLFDRLVMLSSQPGRMVYNGAMKSAANYLVAGGHSVPVASNPTDIFMDYITPHGPQDSVEALLELFKRKQKPGIDEQVAEELQKGGRTAEEMLIFEAEQLAMKLHLTEVPSPRLSKNAVRLTTQLSVLFRRKVRLLCRDFSAARFLIGGPLSTRLLVGVMYLGVGLHGVLDSQPFLYACFLSTVVGVTQLMPYWIDERPAIKHDVSDGLFCMEAYIFGHVIIDTACFYIGTFLGATSAFALSLLPWDAYPAFIGWHTLVFLFFDAYYGCISAFAPAGGAAQGIAMTFNPFFLTFSGFMQHRSSAPFYFKWVFSVSPVAYGFEGTAMAVLPFYEKHKDPHVQLVADGFSEGPDRMQGIVFLLVAIVVLRIMQVFFLTHKNNAEK